MHDLLAGLAHPLHGGDHFLAMLAVGVLATRFQGKAVWAPPLSFLGFMLLGFAGIPLPNLEPMIPASVLVLGLAIAAAARLPILALAALVGLFALFHGHAHFEELVPGAAPAIVAVGMLATTALLHAVGIVLGVGLARLRVWLPRALGAVVTLAGAWLLAA